MKKLLSIILLLMAVSQAFAQKKLTKSRQSGYYTYIYKLNDSESRAIALKANAAIDDTFLHTVVDSFYYDPKTVYKGKLPFGNYLFVTPVKNQFIYSLKTVSNVQLNFINDLKYVQFSLTDLEGTAVTDAGVKIGKRKKVKYDPEAQLYLTKNIPEEKFITVSYQGIITYFNFDKISVYPYYRNKKVQGRYAAPVEKDPDYKGYLVFNKPKYKPLDTVKFKAYVVDRKGKELKNAKRLRVQLREAGDEEGKVVGYVNAYRKGAYSFDFVLADSLDLDLDYDYVVALQEQNKTVWKDVFTGRFHYEDYELKAINFAVRTDQEQYHPGTPVTAYLSARDENDLAVPDGRVEVKAYASRVSKYRSDYVFVPDSLWETTINLDPVGETKLVLPDSIFPKADLDFYLKFTFLNSNNERQEASKYLSYKFRTLKIQPALQHDSLKLDYLVNGQSTAQSAKLISFVESDVKKDSMQVNLPMLIKLDPRISQYRIETKDHFKTDISLANLSPTLNIAASQTKDSLQIRVDNPQKIPFWYTLFSGDKILLKGRTVKLDTVIKHSGHQIAHIRINYLWGGQVKEQEISAVFNERLLNLEFTPPDMVYPGQQLTMKVKVTDAASKAIPYTDVTAFAYTTKFNNAGYVDLPDFGPVYKVRKQSPALQKVNLITDGNMMINWQLWGRKLGLDSISYYQFTHPKEFYSTEEPLKDTLAQVSPFVVLAGAVVPVHVVYIDEIPVFFSKTDQLQHYSFAVTPGEHQIRLRTANHMVTLPMYNFTKGTKSILSIEADVKNTKGQVESALPELSTYEADLLMKYLVSVQDNFKEEKTIIEAGLANYLLNPPPLEYGNRNRLIGPIAENYLKFISGNISQPFIKEPGYTYTFVKGLIRQKSYASKYGFDPSLAVGIRNQSDDYTRQVVKKSEIDSVWENYLNLRSATTSLFNTYESNNESSGELTIELDTVYFKKSSGAKNILIYKSDQPEYGKIYPGRSTSFSYLAAGTYRVMYLFKDNTYFIEKNVLVKPNGKNYFKWSGQSILPADSLSTQIDRLIKSAKQYATINNDEIEIKISELFNAKYFSQSLLTQKIKGIVHDENKKPLSGVTVKVKGLRAPVVTKVNGAFEIYAAKKGTITLSLPGYIFKEVQADSADLGIIVLGKAVDLLYSDADVIGLDGRNASLNEMVVTKMSASAARIQIRGVSSAPAALKPIVIVDGVPFNGAISELNSADIEKMDVLKGEQATALYGSRGASGVIIIKTKKGNLATNATGELVAQQQTMRTNFSDYAFWQPQLLTNEEGIASWKVKFPDDITSWTTAVIAMNGHKQAGQTQTTIKSFKSLSANFVSPQFALEGDRINVIGKLMNYTPIQESVTRKFSYNGQELRNNSINVKNAWIDTIPVVATGKDSLSFKYTLEQQNGYFDGELRKIPVLTTGVTETKGYFDVLAQDTTVNYTFPSSSGKVTLRAEASVFPALLDEMDKLRSYEYLCNEQLASKLKALLLEKKVRTYLAMPFKHEKDISEIIKKLQLNKSPKNTWGWWKDNPEQLWISLHVTEALLAAEKDGYKVNLNKELLYSYLVGELAGQTIEDRILCVKLIRMLNPKFFIKDWVNSIAAIQENPKNKVTPALYQKLQLLQLKQFAGLPIDIKALINLHKSTMFGNSYWGEESYHFWNNSIQNTLLAYQILKQDGGHTKELDLIRRYFLEQRKDGQWRNTYESSQILETILPDLMIGGKTATPVSLVINKTETVKDFPYDKVMDVAAPVSVSKKGSLPIYFTAFQQFTNPKPEKVNKDFKVKITFLQQNKEVTSLKAGTKTILKVEVEVRADADYVMIEVPIPAGCSYDNKPQPYWGVETHREYFKHKTTIFCTQLKQGKHIFSVELIPRYSGDYLLNPAKAEMMYFPVFYGREGLKRMGIN